MTTTTPPIPTYMFRAECLEDVLKLLKRLHPACPVQAFEFKRIPGFPDLTCRITCDISLGDLRLFMERVRDGHVMEQTVEVPEKFTGKRNFEL
jgi:hypothetical protein